jgi:hypothetical protein
VPTGEPLGSEPDQTSVTPSTLNGERYEMCVIERWQGYFKSDFYARSSSAAGAQEIARSPLFFSRQPDLLPNNGKALTAHRVLVEELTQAGWQPVGQPRPWYAQKFRRPAPDIVERDVVSLPTSPDSELEEPLSGARGGE